MYCELPDGYLKVTGGGVGLHNAQRMGGTRIGGGPKLILGA